MKTATQLEEEAGTYALVGLICALLIVAAISFYAGRKYEQKTLGQLVNDLPPHVRRDIAIKEVCSNRNWRGATNWCGTIVMDGRLN
jgi:hypothetical protein